MRDWQKYFTKAGGITLLKQYVRNRSFLIALNQFFVLGREKKALELLRLSVEYKFLKRLQKKEKSIIKQLADSIRNDHIADKIKQSKTIWICWWQGIENAPVLVKKCYSSVCANFSEWDIRMITSDNYYEYVSFPEYIVEKWKSGTISNTHMSDLLRLELLIQHGGLWLDSTILATSGDIPMSIVNSDLFFYQTLKPGANGHSVFCSNWLIYATSNNCILKLTRELLYRFWAENNTISDYFLFHYYLTISCEAFPEEYEKIPQFSNEIPHILLLNIFKEFDEEYMNDLKRMSCFHKLSYKLDPDQKENAKDSYYNWIIKNH